MKISDLKLFGLTRGRIVLFSSLTISAAFFEGFGMAMFLPVMEYIEKGRNLEVLAQASPMWERLIGLFQWLGLEISLLWLLVAAIFLMLMRVLFIFARLVYTAWLSQEILHTTRCRLFGSFMAMGYGNFTQLSSGSLINTLTTETQRAGSSFNSLFTLLANTVVVVGFIGVLFWISAPLTLLAIVFLGTAGAAVAFYVRHTRRYSRSATAANERFSRLSLERLRAFRLIKLTASGDRETDRVAEASGTVRDYYYWLTKVVASVDLIMEPMVLLGGGGILYLAVSVFGMSLSEVGLFVLILLRLLPLAKEIMKSRQTYLSCVGSQKAVIDGHASAQAAREAQGGSEPFPSQAVSIRFQDMTFTYPGEAEPALRNVSLDIPAGKVTALVGPSGAGKTTLADIIPRLRKPDSGAVLYDGVDGDRFDIALLRRGMAFVSQDAAVLDDTVAMNLRFAKPEATESELWDALARAQAADFVRRLDKGLETGLGEHGTRLSGGQKQRLSLARALLQDSSVLILDEPTSSLDSETERDIQVALENLRARGDMTVVIIAHRLSTIRNADKIVVLADGRVVEQGSHQDLMISEDWYARVAGMQSGQED